MQLFSCTTCTQPVYFENTQCVSCHSDLGFKSDTLEMVSLVAKNGEYLVNRAGETGEALKFCKNREHLACNWLVETDDHNEFCVACQLNRIIPNIDNPNYLARWIKLEEAKHRLVYAMLKFELPVFSKNENKETGLAFEFKADSGMPAGQRVMTGHANGLITMNIAEADDVEREMAKKQMDEVYRTVLGHFRHEIAHYYWEILVLPDEKVLTQFREVFGDDREDYGQALEQHYANGPIPDWQEHFISSYASTHPWEDWAETWAHYMHIVDTLETAYAHGISFKSMLGEGSAIDKDEDFDAYHAADFRGIFNRWLPLTYMMNGVNKSMGFGDMYPFLINENIYRKLAFIHDFINDHRVKNGNNVVGKDGKFVVQ